MLAFASRYSRLVSSRAHLFRNRRRRRVHVHVPIWKISNLKASLFVRIRARELIVVQHARRHAFEISPSSRFDCDSDSAARASSSRVRLAGSVVRETRANEFGALRRSFRPSVRSFGRRSVVASSRAGDETRFSLQVKRARALFSVRVYENVHICRIVVHFKTIRDIYTPILYHTRRARLTRTRQLPPRPCRRRRDRRRGRAPRLAVDARAWTIVGSSVRITRGVGGVVNNSNDGCLGTVGWINSWTR